MQSHHVRCRLERYEVPMLCAENLGEGRISRDEFGIGSADEPKRLPDHLVHRRRPIPLFLEFPAVTDGFESQEPRCRKDSPQRLVDEGIYQQPEWVVWVDGGDDNGKTGLACDSIILDEVRDQGRDVNACEGREYGREEHCRRGSLTDRPAEE